MLSISLLAAACTSTQSPGTKPLGSADPGVKAPTGSREPTSFQAVVEPWRLASPVSRPVVVASGADLLVLGGLTAADTSSSAIVRIDPADGRSSVVGHLAEATHDAGGAVLGGRDIVFGGGSTAVHSTVQAFTPGQPNAAVISQLPRPRADLAAVTTGTTAFVVGGYDGTTLDPSVLSTSDGAHFSTAATLPEPVRYAAVAALGPYLWVIGGMPGDGSTADVQRVDTRTGTARVMGSVPVAVDHAAATVLDGQILVFGGLVGGKPSATIWRINPATGNASEAGVLPHTVSMPGVTAIGDIAYLVGGEGPSTLDTVMAVRASG